jgi:uncharacterized protein YndB with AHSA1/START domain
MIKAPPAKVFAAWTDPEKVKAGWDPARSKVECEARVSGRYRWLMQSPAGEEHDVSGVIAISFRTKSSSSPELGGPRRSGNCW